MTNNHLTLTNKTKVIQVNLNRARAAQELLYATAAELEADILIVSEPNIKHVSECEKWITDELMDAAIYVCDPRKTPTKIGRGRDFCLRHTKRYRVL